MPTERGRYPVFGGVAAACERNNSPEYKAFLLFSSHDCQEENPQLLITDFFFPDYAELQRRLHRALQGDLPHALRRRRQPMAIDLVLIPYHGTPLHHAYVIRKGRRFTVALTSVGRNDTLPNVLQRLLREASRAGVRPRYLLLDRGFCSVEVIRYLQQARYAWLMPLVLRAARPTIPRGYRAAASSPTASGASGPSTR